MNAKEIDESIEKKARETRALIRGLGLFDANLWLGKPQFFPLAEEVPLEALPSLLSGLGMENALLSHWDAVRLSAQDGNKALSAISKDLPKSFYTIWTGLPTTPREQDPLPGFDPPEPRVRGVRLFPQTHHFQLVDWVVGELCRWCSAHGIPLFLWHVEIRWADVHALAAAFPDLKIVIETQWQKILYHVRDLFSLLGACPNVLVESSNFIGQDHVTYLARNFGAERLLFGSFLPVNDPYASIGMIIDADISPEEKALIAGGNLRRLVGEART